MPLGLLYPQCFFTPSLLHAALVNGLVSFAIGYGAGRFWRTLLLMDRDLERTGVRGGKAKARQLAANLPRAWHLFKHPQEGYYHWKLSLEFIGEYCDGEWVLVELQDGKCYIAAIHVFDSHSENREWCYIILNEPRRYVPTTGQVDAEAICGEMLVSLSDIRLIKRSPAEGKP